jgi:hypothetical protein
MEMTRFTPGSIRAVELLMFGAVAACATPATVKAPGEAKAIEIGLKACDDLFPKWRSDSVLYRPYNPDLWNAKLVGTSWSVSYRSNAGMGVEVEVPRDGQPRSQGPICKLIFTTHDR